MEDKRKVFTLEDIKRIAPGYRGKPENFDPTRVGNKTKPTPNKSKDAKPRPRPGPSSGELARELAPPQRPQKAPTPQRNESIFSEAIFGVDVFVREIAPRQEFSASYNRIVDITTEVYQNLRADERQLDRILAKQEVSYYSTALLWFKLLDVKAKEGSVALTSEEKAMRKAISEEQFNVPQPVFAFLSEIGNYTDKMDKETRHQIPSLPITVVQGFGGYHAAAITADSHNLFEEVPSLGIAGDMVMALAMPDPERIPNFRVGTPARTAVTANLAGNTTPIGPRRPEILQRLEGYGITAATFQEFVVGTRFNLEYVKSISDLIGKFDTFKMEKIQFKNLTISGGETQVVKSKPTEVEDPGRWNERNVQTRSSTASSTATMGAAYCFGFQTYKEDGPGDNRNARTANWSCVTGIGLQPWEMPDDWYGNRNIRRNLPEGIGTERFGAISMRQDLQMSNIVRRMIKNPPRS